MASSRPTSTSSVPPGRPETHPPVNQGDEDLLAELREVITLSSPGALQEEMLLVTLDEMACNSPAFDPEAVERFREVSPEILPVPIEENSILERSMLVEWELTRSIVGLGIESEVYGRLLDLIRDHGDLSFLHGLQIGPERS
jgi:hypothetical protein